MIEYVYIYIYCTSNFAAQTTVCNSNVVDDEFALRKVSPFSFSL